MTSGTRRNGDQVGGWASRNFDYGIGDDLEQSRGEVRREIAAQIRRAARQQGGSSPQEQSAYERAARIAEAQ